MLIGCILLILMVAMVNGNQITYETNKCHSYSTVDDVCACFMKKQLAVELKGGYEWQNKLGNRWRPYDDVFWETCNFSNPCKETFYYNNCNGCSDASCETINIEWCLYDITKVYKIWFNKANLKLKAKCGKKEHCVRLKNDVALDC